MAPPIRTRAMSAGLSPSVAEAVWRAMIAMTRRIERAMALLRAGTSVTDACMAVGCTSLDSFSSRFTELLGETPSAYRAREHRAVPAMPPCVAKMHTRPTRSVPSRVRESGREAAA
ncbi:helix-turn-helix domain-containing protein [Microtetraspora glauca]|uniref:Helix-turn-helix domain-containing protein n=1 Tax=Microtetraspora glauca TaxID=1996 RepID=A0ABV3GKX7_MICGL